MPRMPKTKELLHTRLAKGYGSWIYCESCNKTIGYLCYVTYDSFCFSYKCKCGGHGSMHIAFDDNETVKIARDKLIVSKSRLCCPADQSPLFTILDQNLNSYRYEVVCKGCHTKYTEEKIV